MSALPFADAGGVVPELVDAINANRAWLSEIDGAIGDGDHGINMSKGFTAARAALGAGAPLPQAMRTLSETLFDGVGGAMACLKQMNSSLHTLRGCLDDDLRYEVLVFLTLEYRLHPVGLGADAVDLTNASAVLEAVDVVACPVLVDRVCRREDYGVLALDRLKPLM